MHAFFLNPPVAAVTSDVPYIVISVPVATDYRANS